MPLRQPVPFRSPNPMWIGVVALVLCVACVAWYAVRQVAGEAFGPPDVAAVARSGEVDRAARQAVETVDAPLWRKAAEARWARVVAAGAGDVCSAEPGPYVGAAYEPVHCTRTTVLVLTGTARPPLVDPQAVVITRDTGPDLDLLLRDEPGAAVQVRRARLSLDEAAIRAELARSGFLVVLRGSLRYHSEPE